ncbi:hypothetical protein [Halegenticoccus soli]|uniref:hypothetical protein n=1 Tax=Halegenticoccus soli TaxID=1985678 RepID=UPI000C6DD9BB|nr:hypothetical protein [Halegenticoccus soli]
MSDPPADEGGRTNARRDIREGRVSEEFQLRCVACSFERAIEPEFERYLEVSDAHTDAEGENHFVEVTRVSREASD